VPTVHTLIDELLPTQSAPGMPVGPATGAGEVQVRVLNRTVDPGGMLVCVIQLRGSRPEMPHVGTEHKGSSQGPHWPATPLWGFGVSWRGGWQQGRMDERMVGGGRARRRGRTLKLLERARERQLIEFAHEVAARGRAGRCGAIHGLFELGIGRRHKLARRWQRAGVGDQGECEPEDEPEGAGGGAHLLRGASEGRAQ
jgi:hypothetical protein